MILRPSSYSHLLRLAPGRALLVHALSQTRLALDDDAARLVEAFGQPRRLPEEAAALAQALGCAPRELAGAVATLYERGFLTDKSPAEEAAAAASELAQRGGRDSGAKIDAYRRARREGAEDYWASSATRRLADLGAPRRRVDILLFGDCDLQQEAEFLRLEGVARALDLRIGAAFPDDADFAGERRADVLILGALRTRATIAAAGERQNYSAAYLGEARQKLCALRERSPAPILIDNLPEPTVEPLGLAERGASGHRNRYRRVNLELAELAEDFEDVHVVDVSAALGQVGSARWLDDGLTSFTHLGSPGWLLTRPEIEKAALHGLAPDPEPLIETLAGDPYGRERIVAKVHVDAMTSILGLDAKKAVVVDLDGVLWPGVLAETGAPFAWTPEVSGLSSWIGLYVGLHEALKMLKRRGIVLAAASRNDEATVRALWRYPDFYPRERLLTPDDFASVRINWRDKPGNIREIAAELAFSLDALIFIDDNPREREHVRRELPEVEVWSEDPFALRRRLLTDPRLQRPRMTVESASRNELTKASIDRERLRASSEDEATFLASLEVVSEIGRVTDVASLRRVAELFGRTTQFNATGRKFSAAELAGREVFAMRVRDRFADHALVAAAVVERGEILNFAMSCRVIGLNVERRLLSAVVEASGEAWGRIVESDRNAPVRNLYRDAGFALGEDGVWRKAG
jgi:FkbH-like protein